jgi:hypothetical protein
MGIEIQARDELLVKMKNGFRSLHITPESDTVQGGLVPTTCLTHPKVTYLLLK